MQFLIEKKVLKNIYMYENSHVYKNWTILNKEQDRNGYLAKIQVGLG